MLPPPPLTERCPTPPSSAQLFAAFTAFATVLALRWLLTSVDASDAVLAASCDKPTALAPSVCVAMLCAVALVGCALTWRCKGAASDRAGGCVLALVFFTGAFLVVALIEFVSNPRAEDVATAFTDSYCVARGAAVCSNVHDRDALVALFGGVQQLRVNWFTTVERDSQALYRAWSVCQYLHATHSSALSPMQQSLLQTCDDVLESSSSSSNKRDVTHWCTEYVMARASGDTKLEAAMAARTAVGRTATPSKVFDALVSSANATQKARVASSVGVVVLAWLAALTALVAMT